MICEAGPGELTWDELIDPVSLTSQGDDNINIYPIAA